MTRVLAAPDKFRGTATAPEAAAAIAAGVGDAGGSCVRHPLADGGEGTVDAFGGANRWSEVAGPAGRPVRAGWRLTDEGDAVLEMAAASGLVAAGGADRNDPWDATTAGTGELILAATAAGARRIIVGLGGSATTDGGWDALEVLRQHPRWQDPASRPELVVCCDVTTAFVDAAAVFGPQKGADPDTVSRLADRLRALQDRYRDEFGVDVSALPGAGAAGGLAGGLAVLGARLAPGFDLVADVTGFDTALSEADLVITGEGHLDAGSYDGKVVGGVLHRARGRGVPVVAVVGRQTRSDRDDEDLTVLELVSFVGADAAIGDTTASIRRVVAEYLAG
ncbi:glycerate kinase [Nakamurella deserti]|uniref:glycerate kinase family protein n=1 Tax=Nakamurella deserti TaxID=2164074 RepID=UPI000DBE8C66|nr:glycerate kinase [Nakamurella deserti]